MIKIIIFLILITQYSQAYCTFSTSCENTLKEKNEDALNDVDDSFDDTEDKLEDVKKNYDKINPELDKDIKQLEIILKEEILTHSYLKKIYFQTKRELGIQSTQKGK